VLEFETGSLAGVRSHRGQVVSTREKHNVLNRRCLSEVLCKMVWFTLNMDVTSQNAGTGFLKMPMQLVKFFWITLNSETGVK
jgi:hypothetical protein